MSDNVIIDDPELEGKHKHAWSAVTVGLWLLYVYLLLPLFTLIAWWLGYDMFHKQMIINDGLTTLRNVLTLYFVIIFISIGALVGWARVEQARFKNKTRRSNNLITNSEATAEYFKVPQHLLEKAKKAKIITVQFDRDGKVMALKQSA